MPATIELECPNCGRTGHVPKEKAETRLVCKKCHVVFHMTSDGRALLGEPVSRDAAAPAAKAAKADKVRKEAAKKAAPRDETESPLSLITAKVNPKYVVPVVLAAIVGYAAYYIYDSIPVDNLIAKAEDAAQATLEDDAATLKALCSSAGSEPIDGWLKTIKSRIDAEKKNALNGEVGQTVLVELEDRKAKHGESVAYVTPVKFAAVGKARSSQPREIYYVWVLEKGVWKLDAEKTLDAIDGFADEAPAPPP